MFQRLRIPLKCAAALGVALALTPGAPAGTATPPGHIFPTQFSLPTGFQPEGIAIGGLPLAYFGSLVDGDIYRVNLITGNGRIISQGPGTPSVGLKVDHRGRLFVAGGPTGDARVVNAFTGEILETYPFVTLPAATFVNDVVLTPDGAYFTDSLQPFLYHVPLGRAGRLPDPSDVVRIPLSGDWQQVAGFNANGITRTPDGDALIIVNLTTGLLYRVDPETGVADEIDLGGATLVNGDGMLLQGRTLYVVRNQDNLVVSVQLNRAGTSGEVVEEVTDPRFDVPTTVASFGNRLYLPNARFGIANPELATYDAVAIRRF